MSEGEDLFAVLEMKCLEFFSMQQIFQLSNFSFFAAVMVVNVFSKLSQTEQDA